MLPLRHAPYLMIAIGLGVGVAGGVPAVLLAELATDTRRGAITTLHQVPTAIHFTVLLVTDCH